jgi:hypothetical protein
LWQDSVGWHWLHHRETSHRWRWWGEELSANEVVSGQLAVLAGQTWHADASEVFSVVEGLGWDTGTAGQAWCVQASVWQEAVGVNVWIAAFGAEDVAQLAVWWLGCADPIVVVVVVVADVISIVVVVVVLAPAVTDTASDLFADTELSFFSSGYNVK